MNDRNDFVWRSVQTIGDDLVEQAEERRVRDYFQTYHVCRRRQKRLLTAAACLVLGVGVIFALRLSFAPEGSSGMNEEVSIGGVTTGGEITVPVLEEDNLPIRIASPELSEPEGVSNPWDFRLKYNLYLEKTVYAPEETPVIELTFGLSDGDLGEGSLNVLVDVGNFSTPGTEWIFDSYLYSDHPEGSDSLTIPLVRDENPTYGTVKISFWFTPAETSETEIPMEGVEVGQITLSYSCDEFGTVFEKDSGSVDTWEKRLVSLCRNGLISEKEFADRYYAEQFKNGDVYVGVEYLSADGSYGFFYMSQNIRFTCRDVTDFELYRIYQQCRSESTAYKDNMRPFALAALEYLHRQEILSDTEYQNELDGLDEAVRVSEFCLGYDQNVTEYYDILQKYLYTHDENGKKQYP